MLKLLDRYSLNIGQDERMTRYRTALRLISNPLRADILLFKSFYHTRLDNFDDVSVCCEAHLLLFYQYRASRDMRSKSSNTRPTTHCRLSDQEVAKLALILHGTSSADQIHAKYRSKYFDAFVDGTLRVTYNHLPDDEVTTFCREIHEAEQRRAMDERNSIEQFCASMGFEVPD